MRTFLPICWLLSMAMSTVSSAHCLAAELAGEWRFADIRKAKILPDAMTPPLFDVIEFKDGGEVRLENGLMGQTFQGHFMADGATIEWSFEPPDASRPIQHRLHYHFTSDGGLALRSGKAQDSQEGEAEWVFFRPGKFLNTDIVSGRWLVFGLAGNAGEDRILRPDGTVGAKGDEYWGHYRLWKASDDVILTTILWVQGHGAYVTFEALRERDGFFEVQGRVPPGIPPQPPKTWRRAADDDAQ